MSTETVAESTVPHSPAVPLQDVPETRRSETNRVVSDKTGWESSRQRLFVLVADVSAQRDLENVNEETEEELGKLLALFPDIVAARSAACASVYDIAVRRLLTGGPSVKVAKRLRERLARQVSKKSVFRLVYSPETAVGATIAGLGLLAYFVLPFFLVVNSYVGSSTILGLPKHAVLWAISMGAMGSVVSIVLKLNKFAEVQHPNVALMFWYAFFKPIIGATFAFFVFAVVASGQFGLTYTLFNIEGGLTESGLYVVIALSFVAGFSERFAKDITTQVGAPSSAEADKVHVPSASRKTPSAAG